MMDFDVADLAAFMSSVHTSEYQELLRRLRRARESAGLTQVQVAARLRRPQSYVSKSEAGERRIDAIELLEFLRLYGSDPAVFLRGLLSSRRVSH